MRADPCTPYEPPDGGWDPMVPGGTVIIWKPPDDEEEEIE